jgi:hypothetical protein
MMVLFVRGGIRRGELEFQESESTGVDVCHDDLPGIVTRSQCHGLGLDVKFIIASDPPHCQARPWRARDRGGTGRSCNRRDQHSATSDRDCAAGSRTHWHKLAMAWESESLAP